MMGGYYAKALGKVADVKTVGVPMATPCDFPSKLPHAPLQPVLDQMPWKPDFYIQFYSKPEYFPEDLHRIQIPKVWYIYDLHVHMQEIAAAAYLFDLVICYGEKEKQQLHDLGITHVEVLPFAADNDCYYRPHQGDETRPHKIGFAGNAWNTSAKRAELLRKIQKHFPIQIEHLTLAGEQVRDFYGQCDIVLNHAIANDVNMRIPEVLFSGRPLLTSEVPDIGDYLNPDEHASTYTDDNILDKIKWLLDHPNEREEMAARGQAHALARHSYDHRAKKLSEILTLYQERWQTSGATKKNPYLLQAAQFRYLFFRYPGDALLWAREQMPAGGHLAARVLKMSLTSLCFFLRTTQRFTKAEYFQSYYSDR